jgi:hypothetical protein
MSRTCQQALGSRSVLAGNLNLRFSVRSQERTRPSKARHMAGKTESSNSQGTMLVESGSSIGIAVKENGFFDTLD